MKYRKKPIVIDAIQWQGQDDLPEWIPIEALLHCPETLKTIGLVIDTLEGRMRAQLGDWIIRGVKGEIYPCKPEIFEMTYEEVE